MKLKSVLACAIACVSFSVINVAATPADDALMRAIAASDLHKAASAINAGAKLNQLRPDGSSVLAWAVESQNPALVRLLLQKGAAANPASGSVSFAPLTVACQRGNAEIVMALLDAGADLDKATVDATAPISLCAAHTQPAAVERMLDMGADVHSQNAAQQTPLMWAAAKGQVEVMKLLIARGAKVNQTTKGGSSALFFALRSGSYEAANYLVQAGADTSQIGPESTSVLQMALYQKQYQFAADLITQGADIRAYDCNGHQPLHVAVLQQQAALVELLIAKGADVNALTGESKVKWKYESNYRLDPLIAYAKSPLMLATEKGNATLMQRLVAAGADTQFVSGDGMNILMASMLTNAEVVKLALSYVPDVHRTDMYGRTALHVLINITGYIPISNQQVAEIFALLKAQGATIDVPNKRGQTPWDLANDDDFRARAEFIKVFNPPMKVSI